MSSSPNDPYSRIHAWLDDQLRRRLEDQALDISSFPDREQGSDSFSHFVRIFDPTPYEILTVVLALSPVLSPGRIDACVSSALPGGGDLIEIGGQRGQHYRGFIPTVQTIQWLIAGEDQAKRAQVSRMFSGEHWFKKGCILDVESAPYGDPYTSVKLIPDPDFVDFIQYGRISPPKFSKNFPAEHISTEMEWSDLVLHENTKKQIREIENWITHNETVLVEWGMGKRVKPGYRALFYGPPGTGKTLTATLLGKHTGRDVFRIDLSKVVSKYIGETEQNLARLFDRAESKDWILFFDEADSLFSKRTEIRDAHDKYANQEVAFLLQRIESFDGLVILATNQRNNIDDAFVRRFHSIIHFPMPTASERLALWTKAIPGQLQLSNDVDLALVSERFEISGAAIMNIVHHCAIEALANNEATLDRRGLEAAVKREFTKEGKIV